MRIYLKRKTGFYGMGSPLTIKQNGEKWGLLHQDEGKWFETEAETVTLQASFSLLRSKPMHLTKTADGATFEVTMNPQLLWTYGGLFIGMFLLPVILFNLFILLAFLIGYFVLLWNLSKQAYIIKETTYGSKS